MLDGQEGRSVYSDDERWTRLVEDFKKTSGIKIYKSNIAYIDNDVEEVQDSE